jgi:hypothetical protein
MRRGKREGLIENKKRVLVFRQRERQRKMKNKASHITKRKGE